MGFDFRFPDVGEGITEGHVIKWLVKEGDKVKQDQVLCEIETDKAVVEIPSPQAGVILKINFIAGTIVKVGEVLVQIGDAGEKTERSAGKFAAKIEEPKESFGVVGSIEVGNEVLPSRIQSTQSVSSSTGIMATPRIREMAKKIGIDINSVKGTGMNGMITEQDLQNASKGAVQLQSSQPAVQSSSGMTHSNVLSDEERHKASFDKYGKILKIPMTPTRKAIAKKMTESKMHAPHATAMIDVDITDLAKVKEKEKMAAEDKGVKLTFLAFIVKACAICLKKNPYLNSEMDEENQFIVTKSYYNIGIAVDSGQGLLVPVIKKVDSKSIVDVAHDIENLAEQARTRKIDLEDLKGGTFTITNWGSIGASYGVPIINYPEVAILGVGKAEDKPVVLDKVIKIRKMLPLSLAFDHRVVDGAQATKFLVDLKKHLEDPELLLIDLD
ncbi:MAG: dihydrolipoamide acetyltransferase family protein [archaeon]|nr:dihydrolipoamide acetyltransferase family protein [archaeon]